MGIFGLFTFVEKEQAYNIIDLVEEAKKVKNMEILIDFGSLRRDLDEIIIRKIVEDYDNAYLTISSSEYDIFSEAYLEFHNAFVEIGIKLVWIVDGIKKIDETMTIVKGSTWAQRMNNYSNIVDSLFKSCDNKTPMENLSNISPLCGHVLIIEKLKKSGAEVIKLLQGGSDEFIASEFHRRKSYAIMTNDTDFLVFKDCTVIFTRIIRKMYDKKFPFMDKENPRKFFKTPENFRCPIVKQNEIITRLKLQNSEQMIILSILKGNDNIHHDSQSLFYSLGITKSPGKWPHITHIVNYINSKNVVRTNIVSLPGMENFLVQHPDFSNSVEFCFYFYTLQHYNESVGKSLVIFDPDSADHSLTDFIRRKLSNLEFYDSLYASHFGRFSNPYLIENPTESCPSISLIMREIRSRIYPYVLNENLDLVYESIYRESTIFAEIPVIHAQFKSNDILDKPNSESERENGVIYGIDLFENIWSHLENQDSLNFFREFGLKKGFRCYILRYLYKITNNQNLDLSQNEFQALFAMVFYKYGFSEKMSFQTNLNQDLFLRMKICPSSKCLTIFTWFTNVFETGKYFCGCALNLFNHFPLIDDVSSSSVLTAFYETNMNNENGRVNNLEESTIGWIRDLEMKILEMFSNEYLAITQ